MVTPMYRALGKIYASPHTILPGDIFRTDLFPGVMWQPLNDEARARMEEFYEKEYDQYDDLGRKVGKVKPNALRRPKPPQKVERGGLELVSSAPKDEAGVLDNPADMTKLPYVEPLVPTGIPEDAATSRPTSLTSTDGALEVVEQAPVDPNPLGL